MKVASGDSQSKRISEKYDGRSVLVTGGAGFIGSHLVKRLVELNSHVTVIDNLSTGSLANLQDCLDEIRFVGEDICDISAFRNIEKMDFVFHLAALSLAHSFKDPMRNMEVNVGGTINVLEFCRNIEAGLVFASTGSVYGNPNELPIRELHAIKPISPYAVSKVSSEDYLSLYVRLYGIHAYALRYFNVYGPRQRVGEETGVIPIFVHNALCDMPLKIFGDGLQSRDFLHVNDVVRANLLAAVSRNPNNEMAMNIGGLGQEISILDIANMISNATGKEIESVHCPPKMGDISRLVADCSMAKLQIGYEASVSIEDGLKDFVSWYRNHGMS